MTFCLSSVFGLCTSVHAVDLSVHGVGFSHLLSGSGGVSSSQAPLKIKHSSIDSPLLRSFNRLQKAFRFSTGILAISTGHASVASIPTQSGALSGKSTESNRPQT